VAKKKGRKQRRGASGQRAGTGGRPSAAPRLSLCLIARDEAEFLDRCLASVQGLVDEIVVVDTGSLDPTPDVARRHGSRVFTCPWRDDFSEPRNLSLERARGKWILVLDCDEAVSAEDHQAIRAAMASGQADAYRLTTRNYTNAADRAGWTPCDGRCPEEEDGYQGWFPTTKVRLWRRHRGVRFEGVVHELVEASLAAEGLRVADCSVPIHHYGYAGKERAADRYLAAGERKVRDRPDDLRARYELSVAYRNADRLEDALAAMEAVVAGMATDTEGRHLYLEDEAVHLVHGDILDRLGRLDEALAVYAALVERCPGSFHAWNNMGSIRGRQGEIEAARECYGRGLELEPGNAILSQNLAQLERHVAARAEEEAAVSASSHSLSVCVIVRDAEKDLERCLASVREVADELVVVDTGSVDGTVAVAERMGARIGHFAWCDDFAAARNVSLDMATGDWILWMDADDYLLPEDGDKVARARELNPDQALYFTLVNTGGVDRTRFRQVKMFPGRPEIRFQRPVHETVVPALHALGIPIRATDAEVMHTGYARPEDTARKQRYYLRLMEAWLAEHPQDYDICFRVGYTLYSDGDGAGARQCFDRILAAGRAAVSPQSIWAQASCFRGRCRLEEGQIEPAIPDFEQALAIRPDDMLANISLGDALTKLGEFDRAARHLERGLSNEPDPHFPLERSMLEYTAHFFLGQGHLSRGHVSAAIEAFETAQLLRPERPEAGEAIKQLKPSADPGPPTGSAAQRSGKGDPSAEGRTDDGQRLTLCMIVRDEEERLGDCLDTVSGLIDELVVIDTGSTDRTVELAEQHGARIGHFPWCDDFAAARNESLKLATGDWVMWLDADDRLPAEHHGEIRKLLSQGRDKAYFFALDDRGYESVSCLQMRLFPNVEGVAFEMPIHEQVTPSLARLGISTVPTDVAVVHTGYTTPEVVAEKKQRYLGILERWLEDHPGDYISRSHVALTHHTAGSLETAREHYRLIVEESDCLADHNYVVYTTALLFLGRTCAKLGDHEQAFEWMRRAEEVDEAYVLTRFSLAEEHLALERPEQALEYARSVLEREPQLTFFPIDQRELTYSALCVCGRAHQRLAQARPAAECFRRASEVPVPRRSEALGSLSELFKEQGDATGAAEALQEALQIDPEHPKHIFNLGMLYLESGDAGAAGQAFERVLDLDAGNAPALLNLGYIAKSRGEVQAAEQHYLRLLGTAPDHLDARANLGHLYLSAGRFEEGAAAFQLVRRADSSLLDINLGLLVCVLSEGREDLALAGEVVAAVGAVPAPLDGWRNPLETAPALIQTGAALVRGNQLKCAEFCFRASLLLTEATGGRGLESAAQARQCLAEVLTSQGDVWGAVAQFEALLLADPGDGQTFRRLGDAYQQLGVADAARICYEKSAQLGSENSAD